MVTTRSQAAKRVKTCSINLPLEILQKIFGYFCLHCREKLHSAPVPLAGNLRGRSQYPDSPSWYSLERHTLFSLCLVSKHFCHAAQPILYHEFMPGYDHSWRSDLYTWDDRLTSFMRTVAQRRDLAALVKRIFLHSSLMDVYLTPPIIIEEHIAEEARDVLRLVAPALRIEEPERLSANDLITLLIVELPNLQHCSFEVELVSEAIIRPAGLRAAGISCLPLKTIDFFQLGRSRYTLFFSLGWCARALFEVSTYLETLSLHACGGTWDSDDSPFPSLPNLSTIRLTSSRLGGYSLDALLSSCSCLRVFFYEAAKNRMADHCYFNPDDCSDHFVPSKAVESLRRHHRTTLESVHLDLRWRGYSTDFEDRLNNRAVFTFQDFIVLEHLFLNLDEFHSLFLDVSPAEDSQLLVQLLPPSIVSLHLAGHIKNELPRLEKALLNLAEAASDGKFPRLEEVRWDRDEKLNYEDAVVTMFAAAGVSFCYDSWPTTQSSLDDDNVWPPANYPPPLPESDDSDL